MGKSLTAAPLFESVSPDRPVVLIRRSPQRSCDVRYADKHNVSVEGIVRIEHTSASLDLGTHSSASSLNMAVGPT